MVWEKREHFPSAQMPLLKFSIFADSLAGFQTYIVACLVWGMPSVQYGSSFLKNEILIMLWAGAVKVKSGVKLIIVWNDYVVLEKMAYHIVKWSLSVACKHSILGVLQRSDCITKL